MEGEVITLQDVFKYDYARAELAATGIRPAIVDKLAERGLFMPAGLFGGTDRWER